MHILGMMKWMINGTDSGKIFKALSIHCVLGKYEASYSCLFCCSYYTVEIDLQFVKYWFGFLNQRNFNDERYQTLQMSFLNYLLIIKAKLGDLCIITIIIIIIFYIFFAFHTIPNSWKKNYPEWYIRISVKSGIDSNL